MVTRIKFCGFTRPANLVYALSLGIDAVGLVRDTSSPRYIDDWSVRLYSSFCGPYVTPVSVYGMVKAFTPEGTRCVQAWDFSALDSRVETTRVLTLRMPTDAGFDWKESQVGRLEEDTQKWSSILLDAHVPGHAGGTGEKISWETAADFIEGCRLPVILAGGLTPDNVAEAIRIVRPYAVDVSSGIESSPGIKDHGKMRAFVEAVRSAD